MMDTVDRLRRRALLFNCVSLLKQNRIRRAVKCGMFASASAVCVHLELKRGVRAFRLNTSRAVGERAKAATMVAGRTALIARACLSEWRRLTAKRADVAARLDQWRGVQQEAYVQFARECFLAWVRLCRARRVVTAFAAITDRMHASACFTQWVRVTQAEKDRECDAHFARQARARAIAALGLHAEAVTRRRELAVVSEGGRAALVTLRTRSYMGEWRDFAITRVSLREATAKAAGAVTARKCSRAVELWSDWARSRALFRERNIDAEGLVDRMHARRAWRAWRLASAQRQTDRGTRLRTCFMGWVKATVAQLHFQSAIPGRVRSGFAEWATAVRRLSTLKKLIAKSRAGRLRDVFGSWRTHAMRVRQARTVVEARTALTTLRRAFDVWRLQTRHKAQMSERAVAHDAVKQRTVAGLALAAWRSLTKSALTAKAQAAAKRAVRERRSSLALGLDVIRTAAAENVAARRTANAAADAWARDAAMKRARSLVVDWSRRSSARKKHRTALLMAGRSHDLALAASAMRLWRGAVSARLLPGANMGHPTAVDTEQEHLAAPRMSQHGVPHGSLPSSYRYAPMSLDELAASGPVQRSAGHVNRLNAARPQVVASRGLPPSIEDPLRASLAAIAQRRSQVRSQARSRPGPQRAEPARSAAPLLSPAMRAPSPGPSQPAESALVSGAPSSAPQSKPAIARHPSQPQPPHGPSHVARSAPLDVIAPEDESELTPEETPRTALTNGALALSRLRLKALKRARAETTLPPDS